MSNASVEQAERRNWAVFDWRSQTPNELVSAAERYVVDTSNHAAMTVLGITRPAADLTVEDLEQWMGMFAMLNSSHDRLRRRPNSLVLVIPSSLRRSLIDTAPDLWSVRDLVITARNLSEGAEPNTRDSTAVQPPSPGSDFGLDGQPLFAEDKRPTPDLVARYRSLGDGTDWRPLFEDLLTQGQAQLATLTLLRHGIDSNDFDALAQLAMAGLLAPATRASLASSLSIRVQLVATSTVRSPPPMKPSPSTVPKPKKTAPTNPTSRRR